MRDPRQNLWAIFNSHVSSEFLQAEIPLCQEHSPAGCADCGYQGDLFSPTHLRQCVHPTGNTTAPNGRETTGDYWWTAQDQDDEWIDQWEDDKRESPGALLADLLADLEDER